MFGYILRKGIEFKEIVAGTIDYILHRREYEAMWIGTARAFEEDRVSFEETHGQLDLLEHSLTQGFEPEFDDSIDKHFLYH